VRAVRLAAEWRARQGIARVASEADVDAVLGMVGLSVQVRAFESELVGLLYRGTVYVAAGLPSLGRAFVKAHELGHHVLGHGNFLFTQLTRTELGVRANREERDAQVFAGALVFGFPCADLDARLREACEDGMPPHFVFLFAHACQGVAALEGGGG
jgi:hypothetical protein